MTCLPCHLERGDHLVSSRFGYAHHGLYLGHGRVIHYSGLASGIASGAVCITDLEDFAQGNAIWAIDHPDARHGIETRIQRAQARMGEDKYHVLFNNCEHFVNWCIEGQHRSRQVERAAIGAVAALQQVQWGVGGHGLVGRALVTALAGMAIRCASGGTGAAAPVLTPLAVGGVLAGALSSFF